MNNKHDVSGKAYDFNWIMNYLGITDKNIITQYKKWNFDNLNMPSKEEVDEDSKKATHKRPINNNPILMYTNRKMRGSHLGHYLPNQNIIELREWKEEKNPSTDDLLLVAHEFAHALIYSENIIGNRVGHGVLYYYRLVKDVVWYATNIKPIDKLMSLITEFRYSCSVGQYRGLNRIFRSHSYSIALPLSYFTIKGLIDDKRSDISELGLWLLQELTVYIKDLPNTYTTSEESLEDVISRAMKNIGAKISLTYEPQAKPFRR